MFALLAQSAEQLTLNQRVASSSLAQGILEKEGSPLALLFLFEYPVAMASPWQHDLQANPASTLIN